MTLLGDRQSAFGCDITLVVQLCSDSVAGSGAHALAETPDQALSARHTLQYTTLDTRHTLLLLILLVLQCLQ